MVNRINLKLYKKNNIEYQQDNIKAIIFQGTISFISDEVKTILSNKQFIRETKEYRFEIDIIRKEAQYTLKEQNMSFDIEVEKVLYKEEDNNIILVYKISTDEDEFKLIIERDESNE